MGAHGGAQPGRQAQEGPRKKTQEEARGRGHCWGRTLGRKRSMAAAVALRHCGLRRSPARAKGRGERAGAAEGQRERQGGAERDQPAPVQIVLRHPSPPGRQWEGPRVARSRNQGRGDWGGVREVSEPKGSLRKGEERGVLRPSFVLHVSQDANRELDGASNGPKMSCGAMPQVEAALPGTGQRPKNGLPKPVQQQQPPARSPAAALPPEGQSRENKG